MITPDVQAPAGPKKVALCLVYPGNYRPVGGILSDLGYIPDHFTDIPNIGQFLKAGKFGGAVVEVSSRNIRRMPPLEELAGSANQVLIFASDFPAYAELKAKYPQLPIFDNLDIRCIEEVFPQIH